MNRWYCRVLASIRWALRLGAGALVVAALASFRFFSLVDAALVLLIVGWPAFQYLVSGKRGTPFDVIAEPDKNADSDVSAGAG